MAIFNKESLEALRQRIDLVELLSAHVDLKRTGSSFKGLCPFHDEKTPSFIVQKGDSHYHCFGCGAHGDAIQFLMAHQKMSFADAVESLAQRFHVHLEKVDAEEEKGPSRTLLKEALNHAANFFHFYLLYTADGHEALRYLYRRGIDLNFISHFKIGLAPKNLKFFRKAMHEKGVSDAIMADAGLLTRSKENHWRDFFIDRILFPIHHASSSTIIGFSGRKYKESTFGGKYINTPETVLFKKSHVLFGLNYCRRRIAKERHLILVEGQIDALRLIQVGLNLAVASQGTAFGEGHIKELLTLGIRRVFIAFDSDEAGSEAACKAGHLLQKEGVDVRIVQLPQGSDPDQFIKEKGVESFIEILQKGIEYLPFLVAQLSKNVDLNSPAAKNEVIHQATKQIRQWDHPLMVHETLRKLAHMMHVPEEMVGVGKERSPHVYVKTYASVGMQTVDHARIIETDLLRWLLLAGQENPLVIEIVFKNLKVEDFQVSICRKLFSLYYENYHHQKPCDLLSLAIALDDAEGQLVMADLVQKKINKERAQLQVAEAIQKILDRNWMQKREEIRGKIQSGLCSEEEVLDLVRQFDDLKRSPPKVEVELSTLT